MAFLSISHKNKKGGFYRRLSQLYNYLISEKYDLHFIGSESLPIHNKRIVQHIINPPFSKDENIFFWLYFIASSVILGCTISKKHRVKAIFTFTPFYTALFVFPICVGKIPAVTFVRADNMQHSTNKIRNYFFYVVDGIGLKLSKRVVVVSQVLKEIYCKRYNISEQKIVVQPNNIESQIKIGDAEKSRVRESIGLNVSDFFITTLGVLNEGKNFSLIINALPYLSNHNVKLAIIGDEVVSTGEKAQLQSLSKKLGVQKNVIFCGWQDNPLPFIASSDLFVYPSKHEGSPNALLEALGCEVPCIGSRIPEIEEILCHKELLFSIDNPKELSSKIERIITDFSYRNLLLSLCKKRSGSFSFDWQKAAFEHIIGVVK